MSRFVPSTLPPADLDGNGGRWFHVIGAGVWVDSTLAHDSWSVHFLGIRDETACWAVDVPNGHDPSDGAALDLYSYHGRADEVDWLIAGRAVQLVDWARTHRFCGRCATPTEQVAGERAMRCPACRLMCFPRLAPAIITLVTRNGGSEALLAQGVQFRGPTYSCLAGFVEPGENLEQALQREVFEEVGLRVDNVRYFGSQPWPFPHSLMLGFRAEWVEGEIDIDPAEIVDANWYTRDALPAIPPGISIARKLIDAWLAEG